MQNYILSVMCKSITCLNILLEIIKCNSSFTKTVSRDKALKEDIFYLHLFNLILECLLINRELLSHFWTRLSSQNMFKFNVEFLLFLYLKFLFNHFFCLFDKSFLQGMGSLNHLVHIRIIALQTIQKTQRSSSVFIN